MSKLIPSLFGKGVRDAAALGFAMGFRYTGIDLSVETAVIAAFLLLAKDASILALSLSDKSTLLANTLKNGFDGVAACSFDTVTTPAPGQRRHWVP